MEGTLLQLLACTFRNGANPRPVTRVACVSQAQQDLRQQQDTTGSTLANLEWAQPAQHTRSLDMQDWTQTSHSASQLVQLGHPS